MKALDEDSGLPTGQLTIAVCHHLSWQAITVFLEHIIHAAG